MKGYIQVYTGNGKGKTTAAFGQAIRASGYGRKIYIGQFMKGQLYGEVNALRNNPYIDIEQFGDEKFITKDKITEEHIKKSNHSLKRCLKKMKEGNYDIIILDEINVAIWFGLIKEKKVLELLDQRPEDVELILTGRYAPENIIKKADLVTEMKCIKHYYDRGVKARNGIEK
jgi:cob(I)alamin adenosyltransferase